MNMTLLQNLLIETLPQKTDPILRKYLETVLPRMELKFGMISALGGAEEVHRELLKGDRYLENKVTRYSGREQSLLVHVLNGLLTAWNLLDFLDGDEQLDETEKYLLCLGLTLHDYNKYCYGEVRDSPKAAEIAEILTLCEELGEGLGFSEFWTEWKTYRTEIAYLAQNTQGNAGVNLNKRTWEEAGQQFQIRDTRRLDQPLRHLLAFGDIAVHMGDPADLILPKEGNQKRSRGDALEEYLRMLGIHHGLVYHRLKTSTGVMTNAIHNAVLLFAKNLDWQPILFFAQGVIYLAPKPPDMPKSEDLKDFLWGQISGKLATEMLKGEVGFKRDGKGLKVAPQTLELFSPEQLIRNLPSVIKEYVKNEKVPATPKRLEKLDLGEVDREFLNIGADLRSDRLAEFIFLAQKEFFSNCPEFITWMLDALKLQDTITVEQTQLQSGGVNWGWYRAAAYYTAKNSTLNLEESVVKIQEIADRLADWAVEQELFPEHQSPTREIFYNYLAQNLEVSGWSTQIQNFSHELENYAKAKTKAAKEPICSLSSGEFASEDQMDSVVLFKPQQYSNKNALGGRQIKRGISKIWSLEMLLRQALWSNALAGKLEERQPVFLYIFPAFVYSPQVIAAIRVLTNSIKRVNFWQVREHWLQHGMDARSLNSLEWLVDDAKPGNMSKIKYDSKDLPFMATIYTTTRDKTVTDAWIEPTFLTLLLPALLGVKVVATSSQVPLYNSDREFFESVKLDGVADFWTLLKLPRSLYLKNQLNGRIQDLTEVLDRVLTLYSLHLDTQATPPDARWRSLPGTARQIATDVLNIFQLANEGLRTNDSKRNPSPDDINKYWGYAQKWSQGDDEMTEKLKLIERLVKEYRQFYRVRPSESSHAILLPLSKALEIILTTPDHLDPEDLIFQGSGQLRDAIDRQEAYTRPILLDKSVSFAERQAQELQAIHQFMKTCVEDLFGDSEARSGLYKGDRALLQENRNRIKSGAEFAYRWLELEAKKVEADTQKASAESAN
jgi:CRISPR-associated protein Csc3